MSNSDIRSLTPEEFAHWTRHDKELKESRKETMQFLLEYKAKLGTLKKEK